MNIFSTLSSKFVSNFVDYTMLREVGKRIISVEELIASSTKEKQRIRALGSNITTENALLTQLYENFVKYRYDINKYEPMKVHYLVKGMIDTQSYDILAIDPRTNKTFDIVIDARYPKSNFANKQVEQFRWNTQLDNYVTKLLYDAIFYGQAFVEYVRDEKGRIVGLKDTYQPGSIFTISLEGLGAAPMYYKVSNDSRNRVDILEGKSIACLDMQSDRYRITLGAMDVSLQSRDDVIAQSGSIGRPFCYEIYDKITSLEMLEQLELASITASLQRNSLVSVSAPDGLDLDQLKEFTAWYESIINNTGDETVEQYHLETIKLFAAEATKIRILPQQSQRGSLSTSLSSSENQVVEGLPERITSIRNLILDIKAIPPEFMFTGRDDGGKVGGSLRRFARYARSVKAGQASLQRFLSRIITDMLESWGYKDVASSVLVSQYCAINTSELDRLEYSDASATVIDNVFSTLTTITSDEKIAPYVDTKALATYVESLLDGLVGASQIINVDSAKEPINPRKAPGVNG